MSERIFTSALRLDQIPEGEVKPVAIGGKSILLCHTGGRIFAIINRCSHAEEQLECGRMRGGWISCPAHGARFDLETGAPINPPATEPIETFETRIVDGLIKVRV